MFEGFQSETIMMVNKVPLFKIGIPRQLFNYNVFLHFWVVVRDPIPEDIVPADAFEDTLLLLEFLRQLKIRERRSLFQYFILTCSQKFHSCNTLVRKYFLLTKRRIIFPVSLWVEALLLNFQA